MPRHSNSWPRSIICRLPDRVRHPRNRFWPVLAAVCGAAVPQNKAEKLALLHQNGIALWDVLQSCTIAGASDSSILQPVANDIAGLLHCTQITAVFTTGTKAAALYHQYCEPKTGIPAIALPSTSPANCRMCLEELIKAYAVLTAYLPKSD